MTTDERVTAHVARFNDAVITGDWAAFAATFGDDAVMRFVNVPLAPTSVGRLSRRRTPRSRQTTP